MPTVVSSCTHPVDPVNAAFWATSCPRDAYKFVNLSEVDTRELWLNPLLQVDTDHLCRALRSNDHSLQEALADPQVCTLLLFRIAHKTDDALAAQTLIDYGADPRGGSNGVPGLLYRQYCWRYLLDQRCRENIRSTKKFVTSSLPTREEPLNKHQTASVKSVAVSLDEHDTCSWHVLHRHFKGDSRKNQNIAILCEPLLEPIHLAAGGGKVGVLRVLTAAGVPASAQAWFDKKQLYLESPKAEVPEPLYNTPLSRAAKLWASESVRYLIEHLLSENTDYFRCLNGRTLAVLLRTTASDAALFTNVLEAVLPENDSKRWLRPCSDAQHEMDLNVRQVLVYENGTFVSHRCLMLLLHVAGNDANRIRSLLSRVLEPPGTPQGSNPNALVLCCLNFACCQEDPTLLRVLLEDWRVDANTTDKTRVPLLHAAVRAECHASIVATLLRAGADPNHCRNHDDDDLYEDDDTLCSQDVWEQRVWLSTSTALDVLIYMFKRAVTADMNKGCSEFRLGADGGIPSRALCMLKTLELLLAADAHSNETMTQTINDVYGMLLRKRHAVCGSSQQAAANGRPASDQPVDRQPSLLLQWVDWLSGGLTAAENTLNDKVQEEQNRLAAELRAYTDMARFLQLLVVVSQGLSWTPALHALYPNKFKSAVRTLLIMWHATHFIDPQCPSPPPCHPRPTHDSNASGSSWPDSNSATPSSSVSDTSFETDHSPTSVLSGCTNGGLEASSHIPNSETHFSVPPAVYPHHPHLCQTGEHGSVMTMDRGKSAPKGEVGSGVSKVEVDPGHVALPEGIDEGSGWNCGAGFWARQYQLPTGRYSGRGGKARAPCEPVLPSAAVSRIIQSMAQPVTQWLVEE